ncbi:MAG TPA: hypothetical protein VIT66_00640 [Lysobacter sp.]
MMMEVEALPLHVEISRHRLGLRVHVRGEETFENTVAYWRSIIDKLDGVPGRGLLLIDELHGTPLSERQWLDLIVSMDGSRLRRFRIAHVRPGGLRDVEYCELYARDANYDARVFVDEASAERWLAGA